MFDKFRVIFCCMYSYSAIVCELRHGVSYEIFAWVAMQKINFTSELLLAARLL